MSRSQSPLTRAAAIRNWTILRARGAKTFGTQQLTGQPLSLWIELCDRIEMQARNHYNAVKLAKHAKEQHAL